MKNVMLVGVGPHSKRIYLNYLKNHNVNLKVVVDLLENYDTVVEYLVNNGFNDTEVWGLPSKYKDCELLPQKYYESLKRICIFYNITHIIISTESKGHNMYLNFALENNINVLSDKPITVVKNMHSLSSINKMRQQYYDLLSKYNKDKCKCMIMCQRRCHRGYIYIINLLKEIIKKYNIPITYIDIYHCDGNWEMPHDLDKENHPYKYGYGKLYHSGYHFIDLLSELIKLNDLTTNDKKITNGLIYGNSFDPNDEAVVFNSSDYKNMFPNDKISGIYNKLSDKCFNNYGEKNFYSQLNFYNKNNDLITTANMNLLHYGFSRRGWFTSRDYYKHNGRIRHERISIQVGPLMNIQIHSYQSKEIKDRKDDISEISTGGLEHFDIDIYRNVDLIGGKPFERIKLYDLYNLTNMKHKFIGFNEYSREEMINSFFSDNESFGDIETHKLAIEVLYSCSKTLYDKHSRKNQIEKIVIPE